MPNPRKQDRKLQELYDRLPRLECQGYCHDSCGPIDMSVRERQRIVERARKPVICGAGASCSMLGPDRRCTVYDIRPMICRLWGLVKGLACPYGCRPEGGLLERAEGFKLLLEADRIGGQPEGDRLASVMRSIEQSLTEEQLAEIALAALDARRTQATLDGRPGALHRAGHKLPFER